MHSLKLIVFLIICISSFFSCSSQNLVPNPSFEEYKNLRCNFVDFLPDSKAAFDSILVDWQMPTKGSSDVYSLLVDEKCEAHPNLKIGHGSPEPKDGNTMIGIHIAIHNKPSGSPYYREYLQVKLKEKLVPGKKYIAGFYSSLANCATFGTNNLGISFSEEKIESDTNGILAYTPQVNKLTIEKNKLQWSLFLQCFEADNKSQYLTIGNFYKDEKTKFYKIEETDVNHSYYFIDSVFVESVDELIIPNVITPNKDSLNEKFVIEALQPKWWSLRIYNRWGKEVYYSPHYWSNWSGDNVSSGVYFYMLKHVCNNISYRGPLTIIR